MNLDRAKINWQAFDVEAAFREDIEALPDVKSKAFTDTLDEAVAWAKACDVLVVSHSLYLIAQLDSAIALAKALPPGARVIVRGLGPSSVFCAPFEIWGADIWRPGVSHLWNTVFLDELREQAGLAPAGGGSGTKRERWNLDALAAGVEHAYMADFRSRQGFVGALGRMYGPRMSQTFESEFLRLQAANRVLGAAELLPSSIWSTCSRNPEGLCDGSLSNCANAARTPSISFAGGRVVDRLRRGPPRDAERLEVRAQREVFALSRLAALCGKEHRYEEGETLALAAYRELHDTLAPNTRSRSWSPSSSSLSMRRGARRTRPRRWAGLPKPGNSTAVAESSWRNS